MINNLEDYFEDEQEFFLDKIYYNRLDKIQDEVESSLTCTEKIETSVSEDSVKLAVSRTLNFSPEEIFELSITYGAILKFRKEKREDINWDDIDLAKEFSENGNFATDNLMSRMSLLIAEITSSFGQSPLVLPPSIVQESSSD